MRKIFYFFTVLFLTTSFSEVVLAKESDKICGGGGLSVWTKDGEFKTVREPKCISKSEYEAKLNSKDYLCNYYPEYIWKESEREFGKKQYAYTEENLKKIATLKEEGISLCKAGKRKQGEEKFIEAIRIISFTPPAKE
ncbi:MAG: hypothetical protein VWZ84_00700 [Pelagibacteraceae bacterium]|jgi:hypothetical protein